MSTNDVPGANPSNGDSLGVGCRAEHKDGSLILVEGTEGGRVIFSVFDMAKKPPIEYRDAMPRVNFDKQFSRNLGGNADNWIWHDKSAFPWDKIIKADVKDGTKPVSADHVLNAAQEIIESRDRFAGTRSRLPDVDYGNSHDIGGGLKVGVRGIQPETAAERVARDLHLRGEELDAKRFADRVDVIMERVGGLINQFANAFGRLPQDKKPAPKRKR